jgi:lipopolysaccharide export system protein LptA
MSFILERSSTLILAAAAALLASVQAHAQLGGGDGPISWGADNVEMVDGQNLIRLAGRVNVRQGNARLAADEMSIFLAPAVEGQGRTAERIEAAGSVVYITPLETARGDTGVYIAAEDKIWLTGRVRLIRGEDAFCGRELVIRPTLGQFEAVGGGASAEDPLCAGRVRGVISAESRQTIAGDGAVSPSDGGDR